MMAERALSSHRQFGNHFCCHLSSSSSKHEEFVAKHHIEEASAKIEIFLEGAGNEMG